MIRSTLKSGIKRLLGVEVKPAAAPPPPPAWRSEPAVKVEPPAARAAAPATAPVAPPVVVAPDPEPVVAAPVEAAPALQAPVAVEVAEAVEPAPKKAKAKKAKKGEEPEVVAAPSAALEVDAPPPVVEAPTDTVGPAAFSMEQVQELFDEMVRPALQGDGGDIALLRIEQNDVYVRLVGSCSSCPSSVMTMKMGVEALLREELPGFGNLIQVD